MPQIFIHLLLVSSPPMVKYQPNTHSKTQSKAWPEVDFPFMRWCSTTVPVTQLSVKTQQVFGGTKKWRLSSSKLTWLAGKSRFLKGDTHSKCLFCHCHLSFQGFCIYLIHGGVSPYISLTSYSLHMWGFLHVRYLKFLMIRGVFSMRCWWMDALVGTVVLTVCVGKRST